MSKKVIYIHLDYETMKSFEKQCKEYKETTHKTEGGFYHKSLRLLLDDLVIEFHGPLVGGEAHINDKLEGITNETNNKGKLES